MNYLFVDLDRTFIGCNSFSRELKIFIRGTGLINSISLFLALPTYTRLAVKQFIYTQITHLDYSECVNKSVLKTIEDYKSQGYIIILATAAVEQSAKRIVAPFKCFDEVIGSRDQINLKGSKKLAAIKNRIGLSSFIYIGDSTSDFVIFKSTRACVLVSNSRLRIFRAKLKFGDKVSIVRGESCQHAH